MIISDLEVLEVVSEDNNIEGGLAIATAGASAFAAGTFIALTSTSTGTSAVSGPFGSFASSGSASSSAAA